MIQSTPGISTTYNVKVGVVSVDREIWWKVIPTAAAVGYSSEAFYGLPWLAVAPGYLAFRIQCEDWYGLPWLTMSSAYFAFSTQCEEHGLPLPNMKSGLVIYLEFRVQCEACYGWPWLTMEPGYLSMLHSEYSNVKVNGLQLLMTMEKN